MMIRDKDRNEYQLHLTIQAGRLREVVEAANKLAGDLTLAPDAFDPRKPFAAVEGRVWPGR